ncbi:TetR/AcrR family transcriptional regulator [Massilia sp. TS11]|uniref:TetR/AcrR family transcriptional regulator n=1 Tax=Massilia sp. TS11 TaxID=2908003 RepID=UPI001EDB09C4|nr:TetR/AcrR family transcriptional regulator [Massilia sp. TS11]MCG2583787.1 TetR/AcrR family transcriptional regulator [Massilia sp. TS11]
MHKHTLNKASQTTDKGYERAGAILAAARAMLAEQGFAALSMRGVAQQVGCSLSTLQHYFPSKDDLMAAVLTATFDNYQAAIDARLQAAPTAAKARFLAVIDYFLDDLRTPASSGLLLEIAALATRDPFAARVYDQMMTRARRTMRKLIIELKPGLAPDALELRAALVVAQLHGMMVFLAQGRPAHRELATLPAAARAAMLAIALD